MAPILPGTPLNACACTPQETITLDRDAFYSAAFKLHDLLESLWPELVERARTARAARAPWPAVDRLTLEQQYLVGLAVDCATYARKQNVLFVLQRYAVKDIRLGPELARSFQPDVDTRLRLVAAAAAAEARMVEKEPVN
jgi:hypothetical protein